MASRAEQIRLSRSSSGRQFDAICSGSASAQPRIDTELIGRSLQRLGFAGEGLVDQNRSLHDLVPPHARGKATLLTRVLGEAQPVLLTVGNVTEAVEGDVRVGQRLNSIRSLMVLRSTPDPA
jgi:hypothetical protein